MEAEYDRAFINKIYSDEKVSRMQSKTDELVAGLEARDIQQRYPRIFELYEEYSQRPIADTVRICRENLEKAEVEAKKKH